MNNTNEHIRVSIIIPIYNAVSYIERCLDTLLNQSLREIEVICVLDCPTDGTDVIVKQYAKNDNRIVVVENNHNLHVAESRNVGLRIARGEYIGFSDHDDYRDDISMYEKLYAQAEETDSDIVVSNAIIRYPDDIDEIWNFVNVDKMSLLSANILPMEDKTNPQKITHCIWHSIYKRDFLMNHLIFFKNRTEFLDEDRLFNFEAYFFAQKITLVNEPFYIWEQNLDSVSHSNDYNYAPLEIRRTQFYVDFLHQNNLLDTFRMDLWRLVSLDMNENASNYFGLSKEQFLNLRKLMQSIDYPIFSYRYGLKIFSKKYIKLLIVKIRVLFKI